MATNRLTSAGAAYDVTGNLTMWQPPSTATSYQYDWDAESNLQTIRLSGETTPRVAYIYTASDERLWTYNVAANDSHWTIRDLGGKVLTDFEDNGTAWTWARDYFYRNGTLLASTMPNNVVQHYSVDHLGSPRLITDALTNKMAAQTFLPFGEELLPTFADGAIEKFTGHERDAGPASGPPLDYMHARFYSPNAGRFLSIDPTVDVNSTIVKPQMWNRYTYAANNPWRYVDPTGKYICQGSKDSCRVVDHAIADIKRAATRLTDSAKKDRLNAVIKMHGDRNQNNGVFIRANVGALPSGAGGGTATSGLITTITINTTDIPGVKFYVEVAARVTHEGQHGVDQQANGMPTSRQQEKTDEIRAYTTQAYINEAFGSSSPYGIWTLGPGLVPAFIEQRAEEANQLWCAAGGTCR